MSFAQLLLFPILLAGLSPAVEPITEIKSYDESLLPGQEIIHFRMGVVAKPGEYVLVSCKEYEGMDSAPKSPAKRTVRFVISPEKPVHEEILSGLVQHHPGPGSSVVLGFGRVFKNKEIFYSGSSGGSGTIEGAPRYVSKCFNFDDESKNPDKKWSVRFTLEIISETAVLGLIHQAGLTMPAEAHWKLQLP